MAKVLPFLAMVLLVTPAWGQEPTEVGFEDEPPGFGGYIGEDESAVGSSEGGTGRSEGNQDRSYHFHEIRTKDFYLDQPCGEDQAMAAVEIWLVTGPPHTETFQYQTIECVDVPWWLDPDPPVDVPDLNQVSAQAIIRERLPVPTVTVNPDTHGITGLEVWLWYGDDGAQELEQIDHDGDPSTPPKPGLTVSDREGPYSISATVWIDEYAWDMGDGTVVTASEPGSEESPAATHVYETKSPDYAITAHVVWRGTYSWSSPDGAGTDVDMGSLDVASAPRPYPVREVRSVPADG